MADIGRSFDELEKKIKGFNAELKNSKAEVRAMDEALKLDPSNVDMVREKYKNLAEQLEINKEKSEVLKEKITELNNDFKAGTISQDNYEKQLQKLEHQNRLTEIEVTKLESAVKNQNQAIAEAQVGDMTKSIRELSSANIEAEETTKSFSNSMTEFKSTLSIANQAMGGLSNSFKLIGGDPNSTIGKAIQQGQQAIKMFQGLMATNKLMEQSNNNLSKTFGALSMIMSGAVLGASIGNLITNWGELSPAQKVTQISTIALTGAMTALSIATAAASLPFPANVAAIAATAAALGAAIIGSVISAKQAAGGAGDANGASIPNIDTSVILAENYAPSSPQQGYYNNTQSTTTAGDTHIEINVYNPQNADEILNELNNRLINSKLVYR